MLRMLSVLLLIPLLGAHPAAPVAHDFHVSYGRLAVQGRSATLQVRFFRDDLEETLRAMTGARTYRMDASPEVDGQFMRYFNQHLVLTAAGTVVAGRVTASGEENDMWWYRIQYQAPAELTRFSVRNTLLFDTFDDQRNIFKVMHFPDGAVETLYFTRGAEAFTVRF